MNSEKVFGESEEQRSIGAGIAYHDPGVLYLKV
jgi:hypothetical protein